MGASLRWIIIGMIVSGFGLIGMLLAGTTVLAQDDPTPTIPVRECAECHLDIVAAWQNGSHANAYHNQTFQSAWAAQGQNSDCLQCHTTGFVARTGTFSHEGVSCEACHGQTPTNHPPEAVTTMPNTEVCADCHTTTFSEWERSPHSGDQFTCATCHLAHPQQVRFESTDALCINCHETKPEDYVHVAHPEQGCVDCHWYHAEQDVDGVHVMSGNLLPTGHDNQVKLTACINCHEQNTTLEVPVPSTEVNTQVRVTELESEVETLKTQGQNTASLRIVQGLVIGLVLGGFFVTLFERLRKRTGIIEEHHE